MTSIDWIPYLGKTQSLETTIEPTLTAKKTPKPKKCTQDLVLIVVRALIKSMSRIYCMSQHSLQIFMGRSFVALNIEIWRSEMNLNGVELRKDS